MKPMTKSILRIFVPMLLLFCSPVAPAQDILGLWDTGESRVEIYACGDRLCGRIAELDEPLDESGNPKLDTNNPDEALRSRPIMGMDLIAGFKPKGKDKWRGGTIYDPRDGKTYKCAMSLKSDGTLEVRGYVGLAIFGKTVVWTRPE